MQILSQRFPEWANQEIGNSGITVGRYGCTITCLSMVTDFFGHWFKPDWMAKNLNFTGDGRILWASLPKCGLKLVRRIYMADTKAIDAAIKAPNQAALIQVENYHWVLALGKTFWGDYRIADPWTGTKISLKSRYKWISGAAIIENI